MRIKKDKIIRNKFKPGYKRTLTNIEWVVLHGTGGGNTLQWWRDTPLNSKRGRLYTRSIALTHYLIQRNGTIWEIVDPEEYWLHHASIGKLDKGTIGVELVNTTRNNSGSYTKAQYNSLIYLWNYLAGSRSFWMPARFPELGVILGHGRCKQKTYGGWKNCPGNFDWEKLDEELSMNGWNFKRDPRYDSIWALEK